MARFPGTGDEFGRFRIEGVLGRGGMGMVFEAVDVTLDRSVALKVLLPSYSEDQRFRERFRSEAAALARLDSPHVVQIYEYGEIDGCLFIATQLVRGTDLERHLAEHGPLDADTATGVVAQVCEGLDDAHRVDVVHRDIKPSNVLLHERAGALYVHLCDFGIALTDSGTHTRSGVLVGSVPYLAPECHEGARADVRSDVYAVGCLLFHTVTGRPPFEGTDVQVAMAHLREEVPRLTDPGVAHLDPVVRRAMAKDPRDRYRSAAELHEALLAADLDRPTAAAGSGGTTRVRTRSLPRRGTVPRRRLLTLLASAGLAVVVAVAVTVGLVGAGGGDGAPASPGDQLEAVALTAGSAQTCGIDPDAVAWCWGWNGSGQLGDGTTVDSDVPVRVDGEGWTSLSTGYEQSCGVKEDGTAWCWGAGSETPERLPGDGWETVVVRQLHSCGLRQDGTIWCWGENEFGQLGDGTTTPHATPTMMRGDGWTDVAVGQFHTCGIKADTTLWCWGGNEFGQLGDGTREASVDPAQVPGQGWSSLTTRSGHTCGVKENGSAWCWGRNEAGQLGDGTTTPRRRPVEVPGSGWRELRAGGNFTCGLREGGTLWCWGGNEYGQLGDGTLSARSEPTRLPGTVWQRFGMGHSHVCASKSDDSVWCWGRNHEGQLGNGTTTGSRAPVPVVREDT